MHLYISNLSINVIENDLIELFGQYGPVSHVEILKDPITFNPIGGGIVVMANHSQAREAADNLNLTYIKERRILVSPAPATGNRRKKERLETASNKGLEASSRPT